MTMLPRRVDGGGGMRWRGLDGGEAYLGSQIEQGWGCQAGGAVPIGSYLSMLMGGDVRGRVNW